ncbi:hypothetical protein VPH35_090963 [Triticum aestivum]
MKMQGGRATMNKTRLTLGDVPSQRAVRQAVALKHFEGALRRPDATGRARSLTWLCGVLARPMDTRHRCRSCRLFRCRLLAAVGIVAWAEDAAPTHSSAFRLLMVSTTVVCERSIEILLLQRCEG